MSEVFILGAGFSRAISDEMPLTKDLSKEVVDRYLHAGNISLEVRRMIEEDFEKALTFLTQDKPWLTEAENLRHKALYLDLTHVIRGILTEKSRSASVWGINNPPLWLEALITYWHINQCTVITLNYDTLIERVASSVNWAQRTNPIPTGQLYPIPFTPAGQRGTTTVASTPLETFKLFKLHGSTNWFYSGRSQFFGEEVFFVPCRGGIDGAFATDMGNDPERSDWTKTHDKTALIIPPTLDKSEFFQHESLRSMWFRAGQAVKHASRVVCMGYSLPVSDLTMAQFLKTSAPADRVPFEIVDVSSKLEHFPKVLGESLYDFKQDATDLNCVPRFVIQKCIPNRKDQTYVMHKTLWKKQPAPREPEGTRTTEDSP